MLIIIHNHSYSFTLVRSFDKCKGIRFNDQQNLKYENLTWSLLCDCMAGVECVVVVIYGLVLSAGPVLLDEFVEWQKTRLAS